MTSHDLLQSVTYICLGDRTQQNSSKTLTLILLLPQGEKGYKSPQYAFSPQITRSMMEKYGERQKQHAITTA